jgi:hypothetical protein
MKIQCACGTKVAFDVTPEMATQRVQLLCPNCGRDNSALANELIREELDGRSAAPAATAPAASKPVLRVALPKAATEAPTVTEPPAPSAPLEKEYCLKHPNKLVTHRCLVCGKAMCPECMALFGYVCSPLCRSKAEARGMEVPVYALQKSVVEARRWRVTVWIAGSLALALALLGGAWFWYAWFGSVPKVAYAYTFPEAARAGKVRLADAQNLVFLHGGQLGRIDVRRPQPVWTVAVVNKSGMGGTADVAIAALQKARAQAEAEGDESEFRMPSREELIEELAARVKEGLELHVAGQNIWVATDQALTRYDWQTGQANKTIRLVGARQGLRREGDELVGRELGEDLSRETVQRINLATGETRTETIAKPVPAKLAALLEAAATNRTGRAAATAGPTNAAAAVAAHILAANAARRPEAPLDPQQMAGEAGGMSAASRLALPALVANARNQQRLAAELAESSGAPPRAATPLDQALEGWDNTRVFPTPDGLVQFTATLLERKLVTREAMKAAPTQPALNENVSAGSSVSVANEMLNEMQRERGSTVTEDESRYQVTVKRAGVPDWSGEVTGPPTFHPLQTVDLITAGTTAVAVDHANRKVWQAALSYPLAGGRDRGPGQGLGPCVERGDTVFVYDPGTLSAFERASGRPRWRLPSVGISGLWFDDQGMLYVNTTTAGPESLRYSKQIDLTRQTVAQILKVDPKSGKTLWKREGAKHIAYVWKQYLYTTDSYREGEADGEGRGLQFGAERPAYVRIRRVDAGSGRILWEHAQKRCPLDIQFHENTMLLLFNREVQELKFLAL